MGDSQGSGSLCRTEDDEDEGDSAAGGRGVGDQQETAGSAQHAARHVSAVKLPPCIPLGRHGGLVLGYHHYRDAWLVRQLVQVCSCSCCLVWVQLLHAGALHRLVAVPAMLARKLHAVRDTGVAAHTDAAELWWLCKVSGALCVIERTAVLLVCAGQVGVCWPL